MILQYNGNDGIMIEILKIRRAQNVAFEFEVLKYLIENTKGEKQ